MKMVCKLSEDGFEVEESKIINFHYLSYSTNSFRKFTTFLSMSKGISY